MTTLPTFLPGQEVVLHTGTTGVLYARTQPTRRVSGAEHSETWYFLPDNAASSGLVVLSQPREVTAQDVASTTGVREGNWPPAEYRLSASQRQLVYVAHMKGQVPPPLCSPGANC